MLLYVKRPEQSWADAQAIDAIDFSAAECKRAARFVFQEEMESLLRDTPDCEQSRRVQVSDSPDGRRWRNVYISLKFEPVFRAEASLIRKGRA